MRISDWSSDVCSSDLVEQFEIEAGTVRDEHVVDIDCDGLIDVERRGIAHTSNGDVPFRTAVAGSANVDIGHAGECAIGVGNGTGAQRFPPNSRQADRNIGQALFETLRRYHTVSRRVWVFLVTIRGP